MEARGSGKPGRRLGQVPWQRRSMKDGETKGEAAAWSREPCFGLWIHNQGRCGNQVWLGLKGIYFELENEGSCEGKKMI